MSGRHQSPNESQLSTIQKNLDAADQILLRCDLAFLKTSAVQCWVEQTQPDQFSSLMDLKDPSATWWNFVLGAEPRSIKCQSHGMYEYNFPGRKVQIPEHIYRCILSVRQQCQLGPERVAWYSDNIQRVLILLPFVQSVRNTLSDGNTSCAHS